MNAYSITIPTVYEMDSSKRFLILYGSQTGQAQAIAEQILERAISKGITSELHCLDQTEKKVRMYLISYLG